MPKWHLLTEGGILALLALLVLAAAGAAVPLFRTLVILALVSVAAGICWQLVETRRTVQQRGSPRDQDR